MALPTDIKYATKDNFTKRSSTHAAVLPQTGSGTTDKKPMNGWRKRTQARAENVWLLQAQTCTATTLGCSTDPDYVTPPAKGSMHNRGLAVDLTLVDANGKELNMGTPMTFGVEAHTDNTALPAEVLKIASCCNKRSSPRAFPESEQNGGIFLSTCRPLSDWEWPCNK